MSTLTDVLSGAPTAHESRPWPRCVVDSDLWCLLAGQLADGLWTLAGLWGDAGMVHMALLDGARKEIAIASLVCDDGWFLSVGATHAPAIRLERSIKDLFGYQPLGSRDARPWLDHGRWPVRAPLGARTPARTVVES